MRKYFVLLTALFSGLVNASALFTDGKAIGQLASGLTYPITLAIYFKYDTQPTVGEFYLMLGANTGTETNMISVSGSSTAGRVSGTRKDTSGSGSNANFTGTAGQFDGQWTCLVYVATTTNNTDIYVVDSSNVGTNNSGRTINSLDEIIVGNGLELTDPATVNLAEAAIWSTALSTTEVDEFCGAAEEADIAAIQSASLEGYWSFNTNNTTQADLSGNGGPDLTLSGTWEFDADHPAITHPSSGAAEQRRRRMQ